jgi:hypothetical protein
MNAKLQTWCAWSILPFIGFYLFGFGYVAKFLPPPSPSMSAAALAAFYAQHHAGIETGQLIGVLSAGFMFVWPAAVSAQMARAEAGAFPWLAVIQYVAASVLCVLFMICGFIWCIAAYRPDLNPDTLRMLNDAGWLIFVMGYPEYAVQLGVIAIAGLQDKRAEPFLPRFVCYATLVDMVIGGGGAFANLVYQGPLAWNGIIGFWIPIVSFSLWLVFLLLPCLLKAIAREAAESSQESTRFVKKTSKKLLQV